MKLEINQIEYEVEYALEDGELVVYVDGEPFSIALANEVHDALGKLASKAGSAVKSVTPKVTKGEVGNAVGGAVFGGIGGAIGGAIKGDKEQGSALKRAKIGLIKGAIRGAKRGAVKKLVSNSLGIASERAGKYSWAVTSLGGLAIAMAGKKANLGLEPGDFNAIGKELLAGGFSAFVSATLEYEPVYLEESQFKEGIGQLSMMIADFLENSEEDYMGLEDGAGLEELGFQQRDGVWYIHRDDAEDLLGSLLSYGETKLESDEVVKLFNQYHDNLGRFATAKGIATTANVIGRAAGISGMVASHIVNAEANRRYKKRYGNSNFSDWWSGKQGKRLKAIKEGMTDEKVFKNRIAGRDVSVTYGQLSSFGKKAKFVGISASMLSFGASIYDNREAYKQAWEQAKQRADSSYSTQGKKTYSWPKDATDEDFQKMYRKVAKKYHPDVGGDTETMQKINQAYASKDWNTINDLFIKLEETTDLSLTDGLRELLREVLEGFLASDAEILTFPDDGTDDFVVDEESGLAVIDRVTAQFIYDLLEGEEDEPTDTERN